jgi:hypothetical protein
MSERLRNERRRIEVGDVVGHEDACGIWRDVFAACGDNADADETESDAYDELRGVVEGRRVTGDHGPGNEEQCHWCAENENTYD